MIFVPLELNGAYLIRPKIIKDNRGSFTRSYCKKKFDQLDLSNNFVQHNISQNIKRGTLRGLHFQSKPYMENKVVRCISGSIYDVIVDIRKNSKTYGEWKGFKLTKENQLSLYIPKGFAHGYQALEEDTYLHYLMSEYFHDNSASGICWNDPQLNISWPIDNPTLSDKDIKLPNLRDIEAC
ncbi:MAG: dTDP-4-dehydrorhamnose 3,5-epimerase [Gammaproteobacteria bacterium]|nr:dTDP-4-dehydrorhamnose 3,5-epimerase [Gammaproteobacteria bacterium]